MASMQEGFVNGTAQDPISFENYQLAHHVKQTIPIIAIAVSVALLSLLYFFTDSGISILARIVSILLGNHQHPPVPGCERLGIPEKESNLLHDEYDPKYRSGDPDGEQKKSWKVKSIWVYPIKSCAGVEMTTTPILKTGPAHDRLFSFAQYEKGRWNFSTARSHPMMVKLQTEIWVPDPSAADFSKSLESVQTNGVVRIIFPNPRAKSRLRRIQAALQGHTDGLETIAIDLPLQPTTSMIRDRYTLETFEIWREQVTGINMSCHIPAELREFLGTVKPDMPFALFRSHEMREVYRDAPRKDVLGWQPIAGFNDAYPVNLVGISSLQATDALQTTTRNLVLSEKGRDLGAAPKLGARRFRANIIVEGTPEFEEEEWKEITIGEEEFYVVARCVRCKLPNIDPDTGVAHRSFPDAAIRKMRAVDKGAPKNTGCLAVQMVPKREGGALRVGDVIEVKARGEHVYIPM